MSNLEQNNKQIKNKPLNVTQAVLDNLILILVTAAAGILLVSGGFILTHKPYYTVSASILFEPNIPELVYESNERYLHSFEDWMRTQAHEIESYVVLDSAIKAYEKEGFKWKLENESDKNASDRLRARLDISQINNTQIMTVTLGSMHKEGLAELVNSVVNTYIAHKDHQRREQDVKKLMHLRKEREKYGKRLDEAYDKLMKISKKYATAVADDKNLYVYLNMFMDLRTRYNQVLTRRIEAVNKLKALKNQKRQLSGLDVYDLQSTPLLLEMEQKIKAKMIGLNPNNPEYKRLTEILNDINRKNIESAHKYLISEIDKEINKQGMLYEAEANSERDLKKELKKAQIELMQINTAVLHTSTQRQEIERIINIWNRINERIEQIEIELYNPGRVRILDAAKSPEFPDPSKLMKKIALGIVAVIGFALGLAVLKEVLDNRIKRTADIEKVLGFPASGFLLDGSSEDIQSENMFALYQTHPDSFMAELLNQITVRIEKERQEHGSKTFALFSLKGQGGVTTAASNILAMIDAEKSNKILIDLNTRHPLNKQFDLYNENTGLSQWLSNSQKLDDCIIRDTAMDFDVLPLGSLQQAGISRIRPSAVEEILDYFKERYEYVFIEGPAILLSSEAQTLAQKADVTMLVLDAQKDTWPELIRTVALLEKLKVSVISVVLNKVKLMRAGYISKSIKEYYSNKTTLQLPAEAQTREPVNG